MCKRSKPWVFFLHSGINLNYFPRILGGQGHLRKFIKEQTSKAIVKQ